MKELIEHVVKALADKPDQVEVSVKESPLGVDLSLKVDPGDIGKIIGRQGRTARALRSLLVAAGSRTKKRHTLDIME